MNFEDLRIYAVNYFDYYCDDPSLLWTIFEYSNSEKGQLDILQEFYDLTKNIEDFDEIDEDDPVTSNELYMDMEAINKGYYTYLNSEDYLNEIIIGGYENGYSDTPVRDFFNDYEGMDKDQIIDQFIKYDGTTFYDKENDLVVWEC